MPLSISFFVLYIAVIVLIIGIVSSMKESEDDFMIGNRQVQGLLMTVSTLAAGYFDGSILAVYIAYIYQFGFSAIWFFVGFSIGFLVLRQFAV